MMRAFSLQIKSQKKEKGCHRRSLVVWASTCRVRFKHSRIMQILTRSFTSSLSSRNWWKSNFCHQKIILKVYRRRMSSSRNFHKRVAKFLSASSLGVSQISTSPMEADRHPLTKESIRKLRRAQTVCQSLTRPEIVWRSRMSWTKYLGL